MFIAEDVKDLLRTGSFYAVKEHKTDFQLIKSLFNLMFLRLFYRKMIATHILHSLI